MSDIPPRLFELIPPYASVSRILSYYRNVRDCLVVVFIKDTERRRHVFSRPSGCLFVFYTYRSVNEFVSSAGNVLKIHPNALVVSCARSVQETQELTTSFRARFSDASFQYL
jgi:hypothetical protein